MKIFDFDKITYFEKKGILNAKLFYFLLIVLNLIAFWILLYCFKYGLKFIIKKTLLNKLDTVFNKNIILFLDYFLSYLVNIFNVIFTFIAILIFKALPLFI